MIALTQGQQEAATGVARLAARRAARKAWYASQPVVCAIIGAELSGAIDRTTRAKLRNARRGKRNEHAREILANPRPSECSVCHNPISQPARGMRIYCSNRCRLAFIRAAQKMANL